MIRTCLAAAAALGLGACAGITTPTITHTSSTLGETDMTGLVCRQEVPIGSNRPQTVCASPTAWAEYDRQQQARAERMLDDASQGTNVRQFGALR
jgi:hypothetical protein